MIAPTSTLTPSPFLPGALRLPSSIATALRTRRLALGLDESELAKAAGIPTSRLVLYESGGPVVGVDVSTVLADLSRLSHSLQLPSTTLVSSTVSAWAAAYAEEVAGLHDDTQPVVISRSGGRGIARPPSATGVLPIAPRPNTSRGRRRRATQRATSDTDGGTGSSPTTVESSRASRPTFPQSSGQEPPTRRVRARQGRSGIERFLGGCAIVVLLADLAAGGLLLDVDVVGLHQPSGTVTGTPRAKSPSPKSSSQTPATQSVVAVSSTGTQATYRVDASPYALIVTTDRPTWLEVGPTGQAPAFAQTVPAGTVRFSESGPATVLIGAGGSTVEVTAGGGQTTLDPPSAPFTYQFIPR